MESPCPDGAWRIQLGYEAVANSMGEQLKNLGREYQDSSGLPVVVVPIHD